MKSGAPSGFLCSGAPDSFLFSMLTANSDYLGRLLIKEGTIVTVIANTST